VGCAALPVSFLEPATGTIRGRVLAAKSSPRNAEQPQVVVYLEPLEAGPSRPDGSIARIRQAEDGSWPPLAAVAQGDRVSFEARDPVRHRLFSSSAPNAFELGQGEHVRLRHQGVVRFYCSLHPWESGLIFVAPSPWFATSRASQGYEIVDVPRGRYHLRAWYGAPTELDRVVVVKSGERTAVDVDLPGSNGS
jgi:hypothetical protein